MTKQIAQQIASKRYENGEEYSVSTCIDDDTIIAGYGQLGYTDFEFPLSNEKIVEIYGTLSWDQYFKNKGINRYLLTNMKDSSKSVSPYWTDEELSYHLQLNKSLGILFNYEKL